MFEKELQLDLAIESASLIRAACDLLRATRQQHNTNALELESFSRRCDELIQRCPATNLPPAWPIVARGMNVLACHYRSVEWANTHEGDIVSERTRFDVLFSELRGHLATSGTMTSDNAEQLRRDLCAAQHFDPQTLVNFLLLLPVPILYWQVRPSEFTRPIPVETPQEAPPSPLIRVIAFLDNTPLVSPQLLRPDLLYPLLFRIRGLNWPTEAKCLHLDFLTTCPESEYAVSRFQLQRPSSQDGYSYEAEIGGHIRFATAQSSPLDDLVFALRAAFELSDGQFLEVPVIGHHELRLRVVDQANHPFMSGNRFLDRHVEELLTRLTNECPPVRDELPELFPVLQALTRLLGTYAHEAVFKGRHDVPESEFHAMVLRDLRLQLGSQDVTSHPSQAGGIPDIKYRGVTIELKVEDENGDRPHICRKYTSQPTQYAGADARQVSVLLVLDLTPKDRPVGDIRNDILLTDVPTHGGGDRDKRFPSKAIVFIVNGNVHSPSDYSR